MRTLWFAAVLMFAALGSTAYADRLDDCLSKPEGMTTYGMKECNAQEISRLETQLKSAFAAALARETLAPEKLKAAGKAWQNFNDEECIYAYSQGQNGTISGVLSGGCRIENERAWLALLSRDGFQRLADHQGGSPAYSDCMTRAHDATSQRKCVADELRRDDQTLNTQYRKQLAKAAANDETIGDQAAGEKLGLIAAERAWIAWRDAICGYVSARAPVDGDLANLRCHLALTSDRTKDLSRP